MQTLQTGLWMLLELFNFATNFQNSEQSSERFSEKWIEINYNYIKKCLYDDIHCRFEFRHVSTYLIEMMRPCWNVCIGASWSW